MARDEKELEQALSFLGYPISVIVSTTDTFKGYKRRLIYKDKRCVRAPLNHALLIVGYDKTRAGNHYWIAKNSWGRDWGNDGYMFIKMGKNICGLNKYAEYPTLDEGA